MIKIAFEEVDNPFELVSAHLSEHHLRVLWRVAERFHFVIAFELSSGFLSENLFYLLAEVPFGIPSYLLVETLSEVPFEVPF